MNEFDAERQDQNREESTQANDGAASRQASSSTPEGEQNATAPQQSYAFIQNGTPEGESYTTPEGGHGCRYAPYRAPEGNGVGRKVIISVCVIASVFLLMGCCFLGAWVAMLTGSKQTDNDIPEKSNEETNEIPGTASNFIIVEGTEPEAEPSETSAEEGETQSSFPDVFTEVTAWEPLPEQLPTDPEDLIKKPAQRVDADGDGKADVAYDKNGQVLTSAGDSRLTIPTVVDRVAASVVEISTETLVQSSWVGQYITSGAGSGVIISKDGYIITNHHVIDGADSITVRLNHGKTFQAMLVGTDEKTDIAILWINAEDTELTVATLGASFDLVPGEDVIAIGNPLGSLGGSVTEGIVSATERQISIDNHDMTLLQISAPINPGNSGGGLFNMAGELVGIVNAKMSSEEIEGLGFAIPVDTAYQIACELMEHRYVRGRVDTGLTLVDVTSTQTAFYYFNSPYTGTYVYESTSDVLQYGDLILAVEGIEVKTSSDISGVIQSYAVGDAVELEIYRNKKKMTVELILKEFVPDYLKENDSSQKSAA